MILRLNVIFLICLNYLSIISNLLEITYYLNNKFLLLEPSPAVDLINTKRLIINKKANSFKA